MADQDLKTLLPDEPVTIGGEQIKVTPFKFKDIPAAAALIAKYWTVFEGLANDDGLDAVAANAALPGIMLTLGDDLFEMIRWSTGKDKEWSGELDADEGIKLLLAVIEVNFDFFIQRIGPAVRQGMATLQALGASQFKS